jgi:hypothetical protein
MCKTLALIAIFILSISIQAQPPQKDEAENPNVTTAESEKITNDSDVKEFKVVKNKNSRLSVPPEKARPVNIPRLSAETPVVIDGNPDESIWKTAAVFKDFIQTSPGDNIDASKKTEAYLMYDEKNLYIAFKCWDEKDKIRATVAKRDEVFGEDNVRVWLDTYDDQRRAYVLGWNPLGIQADGIFTEGRGSDFSIDIVMESKGMIHDWGWTVEVKIPFKSLRYQAGKGKMWGFNAARNIDRLNDEFDSWMPDDRNVSGFLIKHGKITGLDDIKTERTLEIIPSVTISERGRRVPDNQIPAGRFVNEPIKKDIGVTLKYTITPNITLDAAINPDFAEIEADAPIVEANRRFPVFFPERRPFFLEGAEIFQTPLRVFNSRSIIDPDFAAKLTGKVGKNSFGLLVASDNAPGNFEENDINDPDVLPFISEFVNKNALFAVVRLKRDVGKENNVGFMATARSFPEQKNYVASFDGRFKVTPKSVLSFQVIGTHSRRCFFESGFDDLANPEQATRNGEICGGGIVNGQQELGNTFSRYRTGNGFGYNINLDSGGDTFGYTLEAGGRSQDYFTDAGFNERRDIHYFFGGFRKSTKSKPNNKIIRANWFNGFNYNYRADGRLINANWNSNLFMSLQRNTFVEFWGGMERGKIYEDEFGLIRNENRNGAFIGDDFRSQTARWVGGFFRTAPSKRWSVFGNINHTWEAMDFDFGAGTRFPRISPAGLAGDDRLDPGPGRRLNFRVGTDLSPIDPLRISFSFDKSRLVRDDTGRTAFDANIFSLRSTYQFSRFVFTRVRIDYNTLSSRITGQYLFGWTPSPGKAFYVGYNDNSSYNGFNPYTGNLEQGFARTSRTFFIRMSYLFRKSF